MLEYEWGNPSTIMLAENEEPSHDSDQTHSQIFDHYASNSLLSGHLLSQPTPTATADLSQLHHFNPQAHHQDHTNHHSFYDPGAFHGVSSPYPPPASHHHPLLSLDPFPTTCRPGLLVVPKTEDVARPMDFSSRIGLNLGGRTYFSSDEDFVNRLYRRSRPNEPGSSSSNSPRCQAEGCNADLSHGKHYHRRHKVCELHSKAATVIAAGLTQRFCQQCSR